MLVDEIAQHYWRMKRYRTLEAQMYKSKGVNEDGGTALDTANLVQCIDLGLFTSIQRALNSAERSFYRALKTLREMQKARGFVPAQAQSTAVQPTAFPVKQRSAAEEWAEIGRHRHERGPTHPNVPRSRLTGYRFRPIFQLVRHASHSQCLKFCRLLRFLSNLWHVKPDASGGVFIYLVLRGHVIFAALASKTTGAANPGV